MPSQKPAAPRSATSMRLAQTAAKPLARALSPRTVFRLTGVLPFAPSADTPELVEDFAAPPPFHAPAPPGYEGRGGWVASRDRGGSVAGIARIEDGLAIETGAVFDRTGLHQAFACHDHDFADHPRRTPRHFVPAPHRLLPHVRTLPRAVALTTSNQDFYFHWLFDVLPRLHLAERAGEESGPFLIRTGLSFQRESLALLGVLDRCLEIGAGCTAVSASQLIVPCHGITPGRSIPGWVVEFLRTRVLASIAPGRARPRRIFISRRNAGHRRLRNEPELVRALEAYGFEALALESLRFEEQVRAFRDAEIVVAPHGGGLANIVFCSPGTPVLELFPATNIDLYYRICRAVGLRYTHLRSTDGSREFMGSEDYHIDPMRLRVAVGGALEGAAERTS